MEAQVATKRGASGAAAASEEATPTEALGPDAGWISTRCVAESKCVIRSTR